MAYIRRKKKHLRTPAIHNRQILKAHGTYVHTYVCAKRKQMQRYALTRNNVKALTTKDIRTCIHM